MNNSRGIAGALMLGALVSVGAFAVPADLVPAMAALDKAYIPALGLSGQADQLAKAKTAFAVFEREWKAFESRYPAQAGFDREWKEDLETVDRAIAEAKTALLDESNGPAAHEALETVRMTLLESRTRQKIPYFIDYLTLFHNSMEDLLNGTPSGKLADWSAQQRLGFEADLDMAIARWNKAKAMEGLVSESGLSEKAAAVYKTQWAAIQSVLAATKKALEDGDQAAFTENLGRLKPNFIKTFFLFGTFPG